jgi:hypothetical protein
MVHEIRFDEPARYGFAWNPRAREQKIFRDEVDGLLFALTRHRDADDTALPDWVIVSDTYLTCLAIASEQIRPMQLGVSGSQSGPNDYAAGTTGPVALALVQFEVLSVTADVEDVVLQSRWHSVGLR